MFIKLLLSVLVTLLFNTPVIAALGGKSVFSGNVERRMAVTLGDSKTRFLIAEVTPENDQIIKVLDSGSFATGFRIDLASSKEHKFSPVMFSRMRDVFKRLKSKYDYYGANGYKVIASQSFRQAGNSRQLTDAIFRHSGFSVSILTHAQEDQLDYFTALQASKRPNEPVVWDISAESFQLIIEDDDGIPFTHKENFGSAHFMNYLTDVIQKKDSRTQPSLHPLSKQQAEEGIYFARFLARQVPVIIKKAIVSSEHQVLGIGTLFRYSISIDVAGQKNRSTRVIWNATSNNGWIEKITTSSTAVTP